MVVVKDGRYWPAWLLAFLSFSVFFVPIRQLHSIDFYCIVKVLVERLHAEAGR